MTDKAAKAFKKANINFNRKLNSVFFCGFILFIIIILFFYFYDLLSVSKTQVLGQQESMLWLSNGA